VVVAQLPLNIWLLLVVVAVALNRVAAAALVVS
jgi:hypothetical protein